MTHSRSLLALPGGSTLKSSSGKYFIGLDHVRALAAFMVFAWHFIMIHNGHRSGPPSFPLSLLTEGHTGVSVFMALSGYLFAKLLDGKRIRYRSFIWNRFLRLAPLLILVILLVGLEKYLGGEDMAAYSRRILRGFIMAGFPNGGWSITVEFHFYLLLPLLLFLNTRWKYALFFAVLVALSVRTMLHHELGEVQRLSYWTIVGRIDQFLFGILAYHFRGLITGRHLLAGMSTLLFAWFYWYFDSKGGFYMNQSYPSPSLIWIYMPAVEGAAYALAIAWYDNSFEHSRGRASRFIALIGSYSYSIYLFHFFFVHRLSAAIDRHLIDLSNIHLALLISIPCFLLMVPVGYLSFRFIESPFLAFRTRYLLDKREG